MRLISVVMGEESSDTRNNDTIKLLNYGFNGFKLNNILTKNKSLGEIKIEKATKEKTKIYLENDVNVLTRNTENDKEYTYDIKLNKIIAPVKNNDIVGTLILKDNKNNIILKENIIIKETINKSKFIDYIKYNVKTLLVGI